MLSSLSLVVVVLVLLLNLIRPLLAALRWDLHPSLEVDETGVRRVFADGHVESVRWTELVEVGVLTTADGPLSTDVYILLVGPDDTGVVLGHDELDQAHLLDLILDLPDFDHLAWVRAMGSTEEASFRVWRRGSAA